MTSSGRRALVPWLAGAVGLLLVGIVIGAPHASTSDQYDPASTATDGTKALVLLLRQSGATVQVTGRVPDAADAPGSGQPSAHPTDVALLLADTTTEAQTAQLQRFVEAGGVLIVTDPASSFVPIGARGGAFGFEVQDLDPGACDIDALGNLGHLSPSQSVQLFTVLAGSGRCYTDRNDAFVVDTPTGRGHVVAVGAPTVFTNDALDAGDNAGLAVDLMAPRSGTRVSVLWGMTGADDAGGGPGVGSLISTGVKLGAAELFLAFLVYAWWRGRRLGRPVLEPQLVQIGGSELVSAHGQLLQQAHDPDRAARVLRGDLRRRLAERLGLPPLSTAAVVAEVAAARAGVDRDVVARAVTDTPVRTDADLLDLARDIDTIRTEVLHGTAP